MDLRSAEPEEDNQLSNRVSACFFPDLFHHFRWDLVAPVESLRRLLLMAAPTEHPTLLQLGFSSRKRPAPNAVRHLLFGIDVIYL